MKTIEKVYEGLLKLEKKLKRGVSAQELSTFMKADRANISRYLNILYEDNKLQKSDDRPVLYFTKAEDQVFSEPEASYSFDRLASIQISLQVPIQQAKAAILYPPKGLHTLLLGETGVGKSMFAELMYQFAKESGVVREGAPFVRFNCADYAENPQLLISQIFGVKKGAYTGADKDREGLLKKADGGFIFLDEVHRLSAQGQEMLFTFIDKGFFRPLGETDKTVASAVRIIAATTEEPKSYLLNTFTRRIPMLIELPALKERDLTERYYLIELFIKHESARIGKSIYANKNSIIAFLLYDCPNNIGQLKSDIQLACAKAFVSYKAKKQEYILLNFSDLPQHVRKGMLKVNENREGVNLLLKSLGEVVRYSFKEDSEPSELEGQSGNKEFYDLIERRLRSYRDSGMKEEEISQLINLDIEAHFRSYISTLPSKYKGTDIVKKVDADILGCVEEILEHASKRLQRKYDEKLYVGLALHLEGFLERIKKGISIYHPKLNMIRIEHPEAFMAAMEVARLIDGRFSIHTPLDEIGYIAMFLAAEDLDHSMEESSRVGILVIMHGKSTASSMTEVCNSLIGEEFVYAIDMPLSTSPSAIYELVKERAVQLDKGKGIILMVDMGSLVSFADMISQETGIVARSIDMVSTPVLLDVSRKAAMGRDINYIIGSVEDKQQEVYKEPAEVGIEVRDIIITACFTGEGASEKLKELIEESLNENGLTEKKKIEVIPMNILNKKEFISRIERLKQKHNVLAVVGTVDMNIKEIPFISAAELLIGSGLDVIAQIIAVEENYKKIGASLSTHLKNISSERAVEDIRSAMSAIESNLNVNLRDEVKVGILLHMCFLIDKLKGGGKETSFEALEEFTSQYSREMAIAQDCLKSLSRAYNIEIGSSEAAYICKMFISNNEQ